MNDRELAANRDLQQLDDARRLGQLSIADYRQRRRELLLQLQSPESAAAAPAASAGSGLGPSLRITVGLLALVALGALSWCLIR